MNDAAGNVTDTAVYRAASSCRRAGLLRPGRLKPGLPALAGVGVAVATIRNLIMLWVIGLQQRPTSSPENTQ